jgi:hypothetical protein
VDLPAAAAAGEAPARHHLPRRPDADAARDRTKSAAPREPQQPGAAVKRLQLALAGSRDFPRLPDDEPLIAALQAGGAEVHFPVWDDPGVDWRRFGAVLIRGTWDYPHKVAAFRAWLDALEAAGVRLFNPLPTVRWNLHKGYLRELAARGVPVIPTRWLAEGSAEALQAVLREEGWSEAVVKPALDGGGWRAARVRAGEPGLEGRLAPQFAAGELLVQPFLPQIQTEGEWSLLFFDGVYSHAIQKRTSGDEFRVQAQFGGTFAPAEPPAALVAEAERALQAAPGPVPLYGRVDGVRIEGRLQLMELELIEPLLYFGADPRSAERCARALLARSGAA